MWWARARGGGLVNMGMDKSGTFVLPAQATTQITGFTARSGLTGPTGDTLVAGGAGTKSISAQITLTAGANQTTTLHIYKNGVSIANVQIPFSTAVGTIAPFSHAIANGDVFTLWAVTSFAGSFTVASGSGTYLQWT